MNWIRVATGIGADPSVGCIADECDVPIAYAVGCVVLALLQLPEHARDGDISRVSEGMLERWAAWNGDRGVFARAFRRHLCSDQGIVRAWEKHNGAAIRRADNDVQRKRAGRKGIVQADHQSGADTSAPDAPMSTGQTADTPPDNARTSTVDGTGRDEEPPSSPVGSEGPPVQPAPTPAGAGVFAEWQQQLYAAALPHEVAALDHIANRGFRPAVIGECYAIASGQHVVRGKHAPFREAGIADVMRAISEYACKGRHDWNQSYFRGVVRRILDRPPEPPDAEDRARLAAAQQVAQLPSVHIEAPRSEDELEAGRARREQAMAHFRAEFQRNNPQPNAA